MTKLKKKKKKKKKIKKKKKRKKKINEENLQKKIDMLMDKLYSLKAKSIIMNVKDVIKRN